MASAPCSTSSAATARLPRSSAAAARVPRSSSAAAAAAAVVGIKKMTCLCSPTNHPGSFRCSRHRNGPTAPGSVVVGGGEAAVHGASSRGGTGRAAKGRSVRALLLQRIGGGPGELGRRRRRRRGAGDFQPRPSRLRLMNQ